MLQNLTKGKMVEWVVLLIALVALGLSIASIAKPCKSSFASALINKQTGRQRAYGNMKDLTQPCFLANDIVESWDACNDITQSLVCPQHFVCDNAVDSKHGYCRPKRAGDKGDTIKCNEQPTPPQPSGPCSNYAPCNSDGQCNSGCYCDTRHSKEGAKGTCMPGKPPPKDCQKQWDDCADDLPCCSPLTCEGGYCQDAPPHPSPDPGGCTNLFCTGDGDCRPSTAHPDRWCGSCDLIKKRCSG